MLKHFVPLDETFGDRFDLRFGRREIVPLDPRANARAARQREVLAAWKAAGLLAEEVAPGDRAVLHEGGDAFVSAGFGRVERYVSSRCLTLRDGALAQDRVEQVPGLVGDRVAVLTGSCLFGASTVHAVDPGSGRQRRFTEIRPAAETDGPSTYARLDVDERLHPYEIDVVLRLLPVVERVATGKAADLFLHVPTAEYLLDGVLLHQEGRLTAAALRRWFEAVEQRSRRLVAIARKRSRRPLAVVSPLEPIRRALRPAGDLAFADAVALLEADPLWRRLLDAKPPRDFVELRLLSYSYAYLHLAQRYGALVAVEDPLEARIFYQTKKLMRAALTGPAAIVGLYVHPAAVPGPPLGEEAGQTYLYYLDFARRGQAQHRSMVRQLLVANGR